MGVRKAQSDLIATDIHAMTKKIQGLNFDGNIDDDETFLQTEMVSFVLEWINILP